MRKTRFFLFSVVLCLMLSSCTTSSKETEGTKEIASNKEDRLGEEKEISKMEAVGDIDVDENLFSVELTIPSDFVGNMTQEELNKIRDEKGFKSITLNGDGSATYVMTKNQHGELMKQQKEQINQELNNMISSGDYPNFSKIEANKNFTEFVVTTKSEDLDMAESFSVLGFYMYGGLYNVFSGENVDNINVKFINENTGEIISESNSKDNSSEQSNSKAETENNSSGQEIEEALYDIKTWYIGEIWNNFVDFQSYRKTGKDCTGSDIDIEFAYGNFLKSYSLKEENDSFINSLPSKYDELKQAWNKISEQIEIIYNDLQANGVSQDGGELNLDILSQYSESFYEYFR